MSPRQYKTDLSLLALLGLLFFYPSLMIYFVNDNASHILNAVDNLQNFSHHYFRPMAILSLVFDYQIWGMTPLGYHLTNLILHLLVTFLVYALAVHFIAERFFAFAAALLFLLHPIHSLPIFWISGRTDTLCALFYLASLVSFLWYRDNPRPMLYLVTLASFILALLTKEMAFSLPIVLIVYVVIFTQGSWRTRITNSLKAAFPFLLIAVAFLVLRFLFSPETALANKDHQFNGILPLVKNLAAYCGLLVIPGGHVAIAGFLKANPLAFIILAVGALAIFGLALRWIYRSPSLLFFTAFVFISLLPVLRLLMRWYLYIPSVGFCLALAFLLNRLWETRRFSLGKISAAVVVLLSISIIYGYFLMTEQQRWLKSGEMARQQSGAIAETIAEASLDSCLILNINAEIEEVPIMNYGLGGFIRHRLADDHDYHQPVYFHPIAFISWQTAADTNALVIEEQSPRRFMLSLENSSSFFTFPNDSILYINRGNIKRGQQVNTQYYDITISGLDARREVNRIDLQISSKLPLLIYRNGQMTLHSASNEE